MDQVRASIVKMNLLGGTLNEKTDLLIGWKALGERMCHILDQGDVQGWHGCVEKAVEKGPVGIYRQDSSFLPSLILPKLPLSRLNFSEPQSDSSLTPLSLPRRAFIARSSPDPLGLVGANTTSARGTRRHR